MQNDKEVEEHLRLGSSTIYEIISTEGREELARPASALIWSAFVAGICICFSVICEGLLLKHVPGKAENFLFVNLGYTVGFLIVILGRLQLFTENTITVILPLLERFRLKTLMRTAKLWGIVLFANMVGTFCVAVLLINFPFFKPDVVNVFLEISDHAVNKEFSEIFFTAIPAGFLIAALVWMLPSADAAAKFWVILLITYVIAIGDFAHVVAGSSEAFLMMLTGGSTLTEGIGYIIFAGLGNIVGGTGLFAVMAYAQVREEI